jgi:lysophospholipase L1-like esterase
MSNPQVPGRRRPWRARAVLVAGSLALAALLLFAAEGVVRLTTDLPWLGNSATLFVPGRFGSSTGNARDATEVSFGEQVYLDRDGFRVPRPGYRSPATRALLLVGDSVTFGPGVAEPETFAGRLRERLGSWSVLNAAVIGHALPDYLAVVRTVLGERDDVAEVVLVYCLNDLSTASAQQIQQVLGTRPPAAPAPRSWVERLRSVGALARLNEFLRERSKLYLLLRNSLADPPQLYFAADHALYARGEPTVSGELAPLAEIAALLGARGIPFTVVVAPYAFQLRALPPAEAEEALLPQRLVLGFLARHGIPAVDATEALRPLGAGAFLAYDPMHLSPAGHALLADLLAERLGP